MIRRSEVNNILQMAQRKQKQTTEVNDIFREMLSMSSSPKSKDIPKKAADDGKNNIESSKETSNKEPSKTTDEKPVDDSKSEKLTDKQSTKEADKQTNSAGEAEVVPNQIGENPIVNLIQAKEISVDPDTKMYSAQVVETTESMDLNSVDLKKQLENALLLKPKIQNQNVEQPINVNTADLESKIKEMTGKTVDVEFVKNTEKLDIQGIVDKLLNQSENNEALGMMQNDTISNQSTQVKAEAKSEVAFEKIFIKVSDNAELTPRIAQELSEKIRIAQTDAQNYEISLNPASLGKIFVKVSMDNGVTNMEMHFSNKRTMEMMAKDINQLSQLIANNRETEVVVQMSETPPNYLEQENGDQDHAQEQQQREQERQSEDFINRLKEAVKHGELVM